MKVKTAVLRVANAMNAGEFELANYLLNKYRRRFGNRHFTYWLRLAIANGLYFNCLEYKTSAGIQPVKGEYKG